MWLQFFAQNFHFAIHLFATLVCLAVSWLYLDAWLNRREFKVLVKWVGFALLSLSFLAQATLIEQSALGMSLFGNVIPGIILTFRLVGYGCLIVSQIIDPLQAVPKNLGLVLEKDPPGVAPQAPVKTTPAIFATATLAAKWLVPIGGLVTAVLYWRRATKGLEHHLKVVAIAFLFIGLADFVHLATLLRDTTNPILFSFVVAFGWAWWGEQLLLLFGILVLGKWVWSYLTERFLSQLFMVFMSATVVIFLIVSVVFTGLLLRSIRSNMVDNLRTAGRVLDYALEAKQAETQAGAEQLAGNTEILAALARKDHAALVELTSSYLINKHQSLLIITDPDGRVLLRGQDPDRWGDSLSSDILINRALLGSNKSGVTTYEGVSAPIVEVRSAVSVKDTDENILGVIMAGVELNEAFVDGIKSTTGLESSIYGSNVLASTTTLGPDGVSRITGTKLEAASVKTQVLERSEMYSGDLRLEQRNLLGTVVPLFDADNVPVGMLVVAEPQSSILKTAGRSVQLTFLLTAVLLIASIIPAYLVARNLAKQLED